MKHKKLLCGIVTIAMLLTFMVGCRPIPYYLAMVYKLAGTVTDAETGEPLESVEVSIDTYQYSELTNGLGDYELEMAEGTWFVDFVREGYETQTYEVTFVRGGEMRFQLDVALVPVGSGGGSATDIVGTWQTDGVYRFDAGGGSIIEMSLVETTVYEADGSTEFSGEAGGQSFYGYGSYSYDPVAETVDVTFDYWEQPTGTPVTPPIQPTNGCVIEDDTMTITMPPGDYMWVDPLVFTREAVSPEPDIVGTWLVDGTYTFYLDYPNTTEMNVVQTSTYAADGSVTVSGSAGGQTMYGTGTYVYDADAETLDVVFDYWEQPIGTSGTPPIQPTSGCAIEGDTMTITMPPGDYMWVDPLIATRQP